MKKGIIQQSLSGFYDVLSENKLYRTRGRGNLRQRKIKPMVGDQVEFDSPNQKEGYLLNVLPRKKFFGSATDCKRGCCHCCDGGQRTHFFLPTYWIAN